MDLDRSHRSHLPQVLIIEDVSRDPLNHLVNHCLN